MAEITETRSSREPFLRGSIIWQRKFGLPVWAWAGLVLLLALLFVWWRGRRGKGEADRAATGEDLPGDQSAPPIFIVPQAPNPVITSPITVTVPEAPPGGGRDVPPTVPPSQPPPTPTPSPPGGFVSVSKYPDKTAPKESTLWDIAYSWLPAGAAAWKQIWLHPLNADLVKKRRAPQYIQAGDRFFVPGKLSSFRR